jgi:hypothetical protein
MKHPIWIKNPVTKKYDRIPYEHMIQQADGWYVLSYHSGEAAQFLTQYRDYFDYAIGLDGYIFLGKLNEQARMERWNNRGMIAALSFNGAVALFNFYDDHLITGLFSAFFTLAPLAIFYWIKPQKPR